MKKDIKYKLKWRTSDGKCTHKKNNHIHNKKLNNCVPQGCPYYEECLIEE